MALWEAPSLSFVSFGEWEGEGMKTIFLFGAGASHGVMGTNIVAPLGKDLFGILKQAYPGTWDNVPNALKNDFTRNIELGMGKIEADIGLSKQLPALMRDMAIYFARFEIVNVSENLYVKLIKKIASKKMINDVLLSTINYECLIEKAIEKLGLLYTCSANENENVLEVVKLHGSCNFKLKNGIAMKKIVLYGSPVTIGNGFPVEVVHTAQVIKVFSEDTNLYPVMAIYTNDKPVHIAPHIPQGLQEYWQKQVKLADRIIVVGVNPNMEDKHIWDHLSQTGAKIYYSGDKVDFDIWQNKVKRNDVFIAEKFEDAIHSILQIL